MSQARQRERRSGEARCPGHGSAAAGVRAPPPPHPSLCLAETLAELIAAVRQGFHWIDDLTCASRYLPVLGVRHLLHLLQSLFAYGPPHWMRDLPASLQGEGFLGPDCPAFSREHPGHCPHVKLTASLELKAACALRTWALGKPGFRNRLGDVGSVVKGGTKQGPARPRVGD